MLAMKIAGEDMIAGSAVFRPVPRNKEDFLWRDKKSRGLRVGDAKEVSNMQKKRSRMSGWKMWKASSSRIRIARKTLRVTSPRTGACRRRIGSG